MRTRTILSLSQSVELCTSGKRGMCGYCWKFHPLFYLVVGKYNYIVSMHKNPYLINAYQFLDVKKGDLDLPYHIAKLTATDFADQGLVIN